MTRDMYFMQILAKEKKNYKPRRLTAFLSFFKEIELVLKEKIARVEYQERLALFWKPSLRWWVET